MESEQRRPLVAFAAEDLGHGRDGHGRLDSVVLPRLTLALREGERVALLGQSGSGKSTLLAELRERLGRRAAWCPQHHGLVPALAVYHNVYMGRLPEHSALANLWNLVRPLRQPWREVEALCEQVGLAGLLRRPVGRLSGGQRRSPPGAAAAGADRCPPRHPGGGAAPARAGPHPLRPGLGPARRPPGDRCPVPGPSPGRPRRPLSRCRRPRRLAP